jgi:hypothetical protein
LNGFASIKVEEAETTCGRRYSGGKKWRFGNRMFGRIVVGGYFLTAAANAQINAS